MLDPKIIRENPDIVRKALENRNNKFDLDGFLEIDAERRKLIQQVEDLKSSKNTLSKSIGRLIKEKKDPSKVKNEVGDISARIVELESLLKEIEEKYKYGLDSIPNIPHENVPVGKSAEDNKLIKTCGEMPAFDFEVKDHMDLGQINGILDLERSAKISGSGFPLFVGKGAKLERALINFMLDIHVNEHGYKEVFPPFLVNAASMRGTGQLPNLAEDMYKIEGEKMYLIPTAEVPVTNMHANEVIPEEDLPIYYTAYTACFRKEAGSYGKDTRGITRVHQFDKVELVKFVKPEDSLDELEKLLGDAEDILKRLNLTYRVLELCTGDMSFAARKCYDIELWAPGSGRWLEVSSCSVFADFQARRANIKFQSSDKTKKSEFLHTLNGSGVALARLVIAILENYQNKDGSITIPEVLVPYFGTSEIRK